VLLALTTVLLWTGQRTSALASLDAQVDDRARSCASETETRYHFMESRLQHMADRGVPGKFIPVEDWFTDAEFFVESSTGLSILAWVDRDFEIREVVPAAVRDDYIGRSASGVDWDERGVAMWVPAYDGSELGGFIVAAIDIEAFVSPIVDDLGEAYTMELKDGSSTVFTDSDWGLRVEDHCMSRLITLREATVWDMSLCPTVAGVNAAVADSSRTLFFGLALSLMAATALVLAQASYRKSGAIEHNRRRLETSNEELEKARGELRDFNAQLEQQVAVRTAELESARNQMSQLARRVEEVREDERTNLARELHDTAGQAITALKMDVIRLKSGLQSGNEPRAEDFDALANLLDRTADDIRRVSSELRPGALDDFGLGGAISWQMDALRSRTDLECNVAVPDEDGLLDDARRTALFRVFQELLTNVVRHANARKVDVALSYVNGMVVLEVSDDGRGVDARILESSRSLGVMGMRERLTPYRGELHYKTAPGSGTTATVTMPTT